MNSPQVYSIKGPLGSLGELSFAAALLLALYLAISSSIGLAAQTSSDVVPANASAQSNTAPDNCQVPDCPIPTLSYTPTYPPIGEYSVEGVCEAIHDKSATVITLGKGERLANAVERLKSSSPTGGVIEIPWDSPTQCDSLRLHKTYFSSGLTLRGISAPNGQQPRFYCRSSDPRRKLGGTIPRDQVPRAFLSVSGFNHQTVLIENIHVDGYKGALKFANRGTNVVRNSWFHHGGHNGISSGNTGGPAKKPYKGIEQHNRFSLEMCGSEISHYGQGNHTHNFYMHRGLGGGGENADWMAMGAYDSWSEVTLVDNLCHSAGWASCFKSIANKNNIYNNKFYSELVTDPSFIGKGKQAQMLIDIPSCSHNIITGNELHNFKPTKRAGGSALIGLRGRRTAMRGCEVPLVWTPYKNNSNPVPQARFPSSPIHTDAWWSEQKEKIFFPTVLSNNRITVAGEFAHRQSAVHIWGTYWLYEGPKKVSCFLETPATWYERSRLYASNNTYVGFKDRASIYVVKTRRHNPKCLNQPAPGGPGPSADLFEIGEGEIYR